MFKRYHYLTPELNKAAEQYIGVLNGEIVAHVAVLHFPMRKGWKRGHRMVVLPDYQGIGIGSKFHDAVAKIYHDQGFVFNATTTSPAWVHALRKNPRWALIRYGRVKNTMQRNFQQYYGEVVKTDKSSSSKRITYSFNFKG